MEEDIVAKVIFEKSEEKEGRNFVGNWWDIIPGRQGTAGAKALRRRVL